MKGSPALPIDEILTELLARLREGPNAVLEAPPGAGKTTRVPLALLDQPISDALAAQQANVRGDAFFAQNQPEQAREAWQTAQSIAQNQNQPLYGVQFKLDDLGAEEATQ